MKLDINSIRPAGIAADGQHLFIVKASGDITPRDKSVPAFIRWMDKIKNIHRHNVDAMDRACELLRILNTQKTCQKY